MSKRVLILDGDASQAVAIAECLTASGYEVAGFCPDKWSYGYHSRLIKEKYASPDSHHEKEYLSALLKLLRERRFDLLIPTSDESAALMSKHKASLQPYCAVLMPDYEVFLKAYDKNRLMALCKEHGYPHPHTVDLCEVDEDSDELKNFPFPALIKPNFTSGARGMTLVNDFSEFKAAFPAIREQYGDCHLQQFIPEGGRQLKVQVFTDKEGNALYTSAIWKQRFYPVKGGSSCCNVTVSNPKHEEICSRVLKDIGWEGFADFDLIENPASGDFLIMEINPRLPACIRSVFKSGMDYATMIADASLGKPLREYSYTPGKSLRHLGFDVLWFLKSPDRWRARPSWFRFFGKDIFYQDWVKGNFASFVFGTIGNIRKLLNPDFRKAKRI